MYIQFCNKCVILIQLVHVKFHLKQCIRIFRFYFKFHTFCNFRWHRQMWQHVHKSTLLAVQKGLRTSFTEAGFWSFLASPLCSESGYPNSSSKPYHWNSWRHFVSSKNTPSSIANIQSESLNNYSVSRWVWRRSRNVRHRLSRPTKQSF